jgi:hypothetical protein
MITLWTWQDAERPHSVSVSHPPHKVATVGVKLVSWFAVAALMYSAGTAATQADMISFVTTLGSTTSGGDVSAQADFKLNGDGKITVVLTNLEADPKSDAQLLSGIIFDVSGLSGIRSLSSVNSGLITTIGETTYTVGSADPLPRWQASESDTTIHLTCLTGTQPDSLIIGPDDHSAFNPSTGAYHTNKSVRNHNPNVLGSAAFTITVPDLPANAQISDVIFEFGTGKPPESVSGTLIPEPSTLILLGIGTVGLVGYAWRRRFNAT